MTGYPCNVIGSQWCDLFTNCAIFCSKSHLFLCNENGTVKQNNHLDSKVFNLTITLQENERQKSHCLANWLLD